MFCPLTQKETNTAMLPIPINDNTSTIENLSSLISKCVTTKSLKLGKALHSHLIKTALFFDVFLANKLIDVYSKCGCIESTHKAFDDIPNKTTRSWNTLLSFYSKTGSFTHAYKLFDKMPQRNLVSYNSLISGFTRHGFHKEAVNLFHVMQNSCGGLVLDEFTLVSIVRNCSCLCNLKMLREVHGVAVIVGFHSNVILNNALINAYGKCGETDASNCLFRSMLIKDVVSWTSMVVAYTQASRIDDACRLFHDMPVKNSVSWTALISGFAKNGRCYEALNVFHQMLEEKVMPSAQTFVSVLDACASEALIGKGKQVHCQIIRGSNSGNLFNVYVCNALIDMYGKCGDMKSAENLFDIIHVKDVVSWNTLINGFAQNGHGEDSLAVFSRMIEANIEPNHVTFLGVLSACSHAGLINEGLKLLNLMEREYKVKPKSDHYAVIIDLLGRKNKLKEALCLIEKVPNNGIINHIAMWGALLGACRVHGNLELAKKAAEALFELEPENTGRYVMLSNIYAACGRWCDANRIRNVMKERCLKKEQACSWIELKNERHEFVAKDKLHPEIGEIYEVNSKLVKHLMDVGYQPYISYPSLLDEDDDDFYFS
ncbi:pentatricopeptide repeat-containing protein At2g21090-like [Cicer arietinum]|uniref:Pentatricopeptide repeat-containing protein At2g21090-like n=1 Tax=Cicer arietinum TaxID=3827 RepID=A0A1S2YCU6_CICAR|nr:pentatricopeptide repeat-containing protein At2g21090-like [Cicer arietinum]